MTNTGQMTGALNGIRVFDLTAAGVGPWAAMLLAGLGADVIHVEGEGRSSDHVPPHLHGTSCLYIAANRNKRSVLLDLKDAADREKAYGLLRHCDIFVENFRAGVVERLGFGYEQVRQFRPDIVYCSLNGWGKTGPMVDEVANDPAVQAFSGWASINGMPRGPGQMYRHLALLDVTTASYGALAILGAILHRKRTGEGQYIEVTMLGSALSVQATRLAEYFVTGQQPPNRGSASSNTAPNEAFLCADRQYLAVGVVQEEQWPRFCRAIGRPELADDAQFRTSADRVRHRDVLSGLLMDVFKQRHTRWWMKRLTEERVPHARFMEFEDLRFHPQVIENDFLRPFQTRHWGPVYFGGWPWKSATAVEPMRPGPLPGEHTTQVLAEFGLDNPPSRDNSPARAGGAEARASMSLLRGYKVLELGQGVSAPYCGLLLGEMGAEVVKVEPLVGDRTRHLGPFVDGGESGLFKTLNLHKRSVSIDWTTSQGRELVRLLAGHRRQLLERVERDQYYDEISKE
ncbi:MAG: CoA transferase, partial [Chloroflexota bacterium]